MRRDDAPGTVANRNIDFLTHDQVLQHQHLVAPRVVCPDGGRTLLCERSEAVGQINYIVQLRRLRGFEFLSKIVCEHFL